MEFNKNIILSADSYKYSMPDQYPPNTEEVYSYFESRGGEFSEVVFYGLQAYIKEYLEGSVVTTGNINEAEYFLSRHFATPVFKRALWEYIRDEHNGVLPIRIKAVPEGTVVPTGMPLFTVESTDPKCYWLTTHLETLLSKVWYPTTVATSSREQKKIIRKYADLTSDDPFIDFKLHDFGFRGVSSYESAGFGGSAHLVNFQGTDTIAALQFIAEYYSNADEVYGFSIPAAEHSTITSWLQENEVNAFENMLTQFPSGLVAVVSDSYNIFNAVDNYWGRDLRDKVLNRDGTLVIRPDSGDDIPGIISRLLFSLGESFGFTFNSKGYKVLDPHVRLIQGDGINRHSIEQILARMERGDWAVDNIAFGSGGALLQKVDRDTCKCAYKCSHVTVNGEERDVFKNPVTDPGKKSKKGKLALIRNESGEYSTVAAPAEGDLLQTVFENGSLTKEHSFEEIRKRAAI